jgi:DNA-binding MarR family transcriptional regulator
MLAASQALQPASDSSFRAARAWLQLLRAHATITRRLNRELNIEHGLTITRYRALELLSRPDSRPMKQSDVAQSLLVTPSSVTRLLARLEEAGLVERAISPTDHRVGYARVTDSGASKLAKASRSHFDAVRSSLETRLTADEIDQLIQLLGKVLGAEPDDAATKP